MARLLLVDGLAELNLLESQQMRNVKYKLFIPRAEMQSHFRAIWSTKDGTKDKVVLVTSDLIAVATLPPDEKVPASCVRATYFKI